MVWFPVWQKVPQTEPNQTSPTLVKGEREEGVVVVVEEGGKEGGSSDHCRCHQLCHCCCCQL